MMKKMQAISFVTLLTALVLALPASAPAFNIEVGETFSTGEPVLIKVIADDTVNAADIALTLEKPDGSVIKMAPRQERWSASNEAFDIYTIDINGIYKLTAENSQTQQTAAANFSVGLFSRGSVVFLLFSTAVFVVCMLYWLFKVKGRGAVA